ncbi:MAG: DUF354 domain-containing protein [Pseudomonadota bacterium]
MKIWIDLTNAPHVNFFAGLIRELSGEHEFLLTSRPLSNTLDLLHQHGMQHEVVGRHYGRSKLRKLGGFGVRCAHLFKALRNRAIDVAISHSSYYSPPVARALGIPCIYLTDNEHAGGNRFAFPFASHVLVPEFFSAAALRRQGARATTVTRFPGIKEGIYLWPLARADRLAPRAQAGKPLIVVRPEPWAAHYNRGRYASFDGLLKELPSLGRVLLLPRGDEQLAYFRQAHFAGVRIPDEPLTLTEFEDRCDLFVGAGGTMAREAAALGIPAVSIYQDELLAVDRFLIDSGALVHKPDADARFLGSVMDGQSRRAADANLLAKGKRAYDLIKATLHSAARSR